jgi:hypothetical protein
VLYILKDGAPAPVSVLVGITDGTATEIRGGAIRAGDKVITGIDRKRQERRRIRL